MSEPFSRRDFLKLAGVGLATIVGYEAKQVWDNYQKFVNLHHYLPPTSQPTIEPTFEPTQPPTPEPVYQNNSYVPPSEVNPVSPEIFGAEIRPENFSLGPFYPFIPYTIEIPDQIIPGYPRQNIAIRQPMLVDKYKIDLWKTNAFEDWRNNSAADLTYLTNDPETRTHFGLLVHSGWPKEGPLPGQRFREWARYVKGTDYFIGKSLGFYQEVPDLKTKRRFDMKITDFRTITGEDFYSHLHYFSEQQPQFLSVTELGIPPVSKKDNFAVTFIFCVDDFQKDPQGKYKTNDLGIILPVPGTLTNNRGLLTLEMQSFTG